MSALRLAMKMIVAPHYHANEGFFRPLTVQIPEGTVANPVSPAPVFLYGWATMAVGEALFAAFAKGAPERSISRTGGDIGPVLWSGIDPETGAYYAGGGDEACGAGAAVDQDGENALIHFALGECRNIPIEILEERYPIITESYGLRADSGGAGRYRGGLGVSREWRVLGDVSLITVIEQTKNAPDGVDGGKAGMANTILLYPETDKARHAGKLTGFKLRKNEHMRVMTAGGAGWGNPFDREVASVLADVTAGYITAEAAEANYGVAVRENDKGYAVDEDRTAMLRKERKALPA